MEINQTLLVIAALGVGIFFFCLGILLMTNHKLQNWFIKWWYPTAETEAEKKKKRNYIRLVDGTLLILLGLYILGSMLGMLNFHF